MVNGINHASTTGSKENTGAEESNWGTDIWSLVKFAMTGAITSIASNNLQSQLTHEVCQIILVIVQYIGSAYEKV